MIYIGLRYAGCDLVKYNAIRVFLVINDMFLLSIVGEYKSAGDYRKQISQ